MRCHVVGAQRALRAWPRRTAGALGVLLVVAVGASAQLTADFVSATSATEKVPRTSGDWVVWTEDVEPVGSWGTVLAKNLADGEVYVLGEGFLPDVASYPESKGGGAAVPPPGACGPAVTRVAWLRYEPDQTFSVVNACFDGSDWLAETLATGFALADHVRVAGNYTAWSAPGPGGLLRVHLHDGVTTKTVSGHGSAFRPALARNGSRFALVWDEYAGGPGDYDYEVHGMFQQPGGAWSPAENLSQAPLGIDLVPTVAIAPDGSAWIAWQSDRGSLGTQPFVACRLPDGQLRYPAPYPPSADPAKVGKVQITGVTAGLRPQLHVDRDGRVWLIVETKLYGPLLATWEKFLVYSTYDGNTWAAPGQLPGDIRSEEWVDTESVPDGVRVVYEFNTKITRSTDIATVQLDSPGAPGPVLLQPAPGPAAPPAPLPALALPVEREVIVDGRARELVFADLHSHSGYSPDALGERDQCLFYARDVARLDVWASTDHDEGLNDPLLDWEYAMGLRLVEHFDAPDFTTFMGYEWTNSTDLYQDETIGHRATFSSGTCYRFTDQQSDELTEYYAFMQQEDAIGVPHHLSFFGGTTFLLFDACVQPVTEISSVHGVFEDTLVGKLLDDSVRFGVTSAGDNHIATPGFAGVAGVLVDPALERHAGFKDALRERLSFGARRDGMYLDLTLNDRPLGAEQAHAGPSLLRYRVAELPGEEELNVNISRNGAWSAPVDQRALTPGGSLEAAVLLPADTEPAFYMLRVTKTATGLEPDDTLLWSSPLWIDPEPADDYPAVSVTLPTGDAPAGSPVSLSVVVQDPQGVTDIHAIRLHVTLGGQLVTTIESPLLEQLALVSPVPDGVQFRFTGSGLPPGEWAFLADARDGAGHFSVAQAMLTITP